MADDYDYAFKLNHSLNYYMCLSENIFNESEYGAQNECILCDTITLS